jgi:uncharacterized protein YdiU (UPF0061 family)
MPFHLPASDSLALVQNIQPTPIPEPYWIGFSEIVAKNLAIPTQDGLPIDSAWLQVLAGNQTQLDKQVFRPYATAYSGHQFGV